MPRIVEVRSRAALAAPLMVAALLWPAAAGAQDAPPRPEDVDPNPAWSRVLAGYVDGEGLVDYARLHAEGRADLDEALRYFAETDPAALPSDDHRKAFWMNAYNAVVIGQVIERYPIDSVRDVGVLGGLIGGFFKKEYPVAGRQMSADDIEHGTLRATWPRNAEIHWALVCAAFGCPRLLQEPYRAGGLDATLEARGREFLSQPRGLQIDRESDTLWLSSYFDWYAEDFERVAGSVIGYVLAFVDEETGAWIRARGDDLDVRIMDYDWALNDTAAGPRARRPVPR